MDRPLSLVTGACGFMGTHMCEVLKEAGHRIRATDMPAAHEKDDRVRGRFPSAVDAAGAEFVPLDLANPTGLDRLLEGVDYVFHVAGVFSYSAPYAVLHKVNVEGTRALLDAVQARKQPLKHFVFWGAGGAYGLASWRPGETFRETDPTLPGNPYLRSKVIAEGLVADAGRTRGLVWSSLRPTTVYGPRAVYGSGMMLMQAAKMKVAAMPRNFTARIPWVHVRDVCRAALHLAQKPTSGGIFNLNDDTQMTTTDFFRYMAGLTGHKYLELPSVPIDQLKPLIRSVASALQSVTSALGVPSPVEADTIDYLNEDFSYSNDKLKASGYVFQYPEARDGLRDTLAWYRENGWLEGNGG